MQANGFDPKCREVRDTSRERLERVSKGCEPIAPQVYFFLSFSQTSSIITSISVERTSRAKAEAKTSPLPSFSLLVGVT
jgi:hypothetical protein